MEYNVFDIVCNDSPTSILNLELAFGNLEFANMTQITARLPDAVVEALDAAATALHRGRADIVRQAVDRYLEDFDDLSVALERLRDPTDPVLDWEKVRDELLGLDQAERRHGPRPGAGG